MRLFSRKPKQRLRELGESEAYHHSYGEPPRDVKIVKLEPRRPRYRQVLADGERMRQAFVQRLDNRDKEEQVVAGYDVADVGELEAEGPGGMVRKVRRAVDGKAFGFNYFILPPNQEGREHEHSDTNQEEVYFVVKGSGTMRVAATRSSSYQVASFVWIPP
jgi:Thermophilic glucose-6-phosphate isomerase and related metalloenzymes